MSASLVLCVAGLVADRRVWRLLAPAGAFVLLYSFLPHKELRFIVYVFPVLNLGAAVGFARIWRFKFWGQRLLQLTAVGLIVGTLLTTALFATASSMNYPGGVALQQAHSLDYAAMSLRPPISIHIAVPPAQTGISRFGESLSGAFTYSKAETWTNEIGPDNFDLMITGPEGPDIYENRTVAFAVEV
jgi:alpha-1,6-mannosyltransferase